MQARRVPVIYLECREANHGRKGERMDIGVPIKNLGMFDVSALTQCVLQQEEAVWFEFAHRQKTYDVHKDTSSIVLLFCDDAWPDISVSKQVGWDVLSEAAVPLFDQVLAGRYPPGGKIIRAMAARLHPGGRITTHVDHRPSFHAGHRIHLPLVTNPGTRFMLDGRPVKMDVGKAYEINNQKPHSVMNNGTENRIHFIFDYIPPNQVEA